MQTKTKSSQKNAQKRRARERRKLENWAASRIQLQVRFNFLCSSYAWMTPEKERILDQIISSVQGKIHGEIHNWTREALSLYFFAYRINGHINDTYISTSAVRYFFVRDGKEYVFTTSGSFYKLVDQVSLKRMSLEHLKTLEAIEIRGRILEWYKNKK